MRLMAILAVLALAAGCGMTGQVACDYPDGPMGSSLKATVATGATGTQLDATVVCPVGTRIETPDYTAECSVVDNTATVKVTAKMK